MPILKRRSKVEAPDAIEILRPVRAGGKSFHAGQIARKGVDLESAEIFGLLNVGKAIVSKADPFPDGPDEQGEGDIPAGEETPRRRGRPRKLSE